MIRGFRLRKGHVLALAVTAALATLWACSNMGEGERCETANGNDDCQSGLVCRLTSGVQLCCPPLGQPSSSLECNGATSGGGTNVEPENEAGTGDAATDADATTEPDAGGDAGTDAETTDASDAGGDADADAGP